MALDLIDNHSNKIQIYTDASKTTAGNTSAAFYVPSSNIEKSMRLNDKLTIFACELTALKLALDWIKNELDSNNDKNFVIFSDSLSSLQSIASGKTKSRPDLLNSVLELIHKCHRNLTIV